MTRSSVRFHVPEPTPTPAWYKLTAGGTKYAISPWPKGLSQNGLSRLGCSTRDAQSLCFRLSASVRRRAGAPGGGLRRLRVPALRQGRVLGNQLSERKNCRRADHMDGFGGGAAATSGKRESRNGGESEYGRKTHNCCIPVSGSSRSFAVLIEHCDRVYSSTMTQS